MRLPHPLPYLKKNTLEYWHYPKGLCRLTVPVRTKSTGNISLHILPLWGPRGKKRKVLFIYFTLYLFILYFVYFIFYLFILYFIFYFIFRLFILYFVCLFYILLIYFIFYLFILYFICLFYF